MGISFVAQHSVQLTGTNKSVIITLIMCDKPSSELLSEIEGAKTDNMKHVETRERVGSTHDMALVGIGKFDKSKLKHSETQEKTVLPSAEDILKEKEEAKC